MLKAIICKLRGHKMTRVSINGRYRYCERCGHKEPAPMVELAEFAHRYLEATTGLNEQIMGVARKDYLPRKRP